MVESRLTPSFLSIIYCFLSTCLGVQLRRSDFFSAFSLPTPASVRARDRERAQRIQARRSGAGALGQAEEYELELDDMADLDGVGGGIYGRMGMGGGGIGGGMSEEVEMLRRGGRGFI